MERYKFKTSLGHVILTLDPNEFKTMTWESRDKFGKLNGEEVSQIQNTEFSIESGEENIENLYDGWLSHIIKTENEELFAIIELSDGYYGSPEYYLEKIN